MSESGFCSRPCGALRNGTRNIRTALKRFESYGFLTSETTNHGTMISIVNWDKYQGYDEGANKHFNKALTNTSQTPNKPIKEEDKEDKEDKEEKKVEEQT